MDKDLQLFEHIFIDNHADRTLFLFHGTGGGKEDFLFLEKFLGKKYNLVGLKGNEDEHGLTRFFKRVSEGIFDQENLKQETEKLSNFLRAWKEIHQIKVGDMYFLGFSNGANMILATLLSYPEVIKNAVLLHVILPFGKNSIDLSGHKIFVSEGVEDAMISSEQRALLHTALQASGAQLTYKEYPFGHQIIPAEMKDVVSFLS